MNDPCNTNGIIEYSITDTDMRQNYDEINSKYNFTDEKTVPLYNYAYLDDFEKNMTANKFCIKKKNIPSNTNTFTKIISKTLLGVIIIAVLIVMYVLLLMLLYYNDYDRNNNNKKIIVYFWHILPYYIWNLNLNYDSKSLMIFLKALFNTLSVSLFLVEILSIIIFVGFSLCVCVLIIFYVKKNVLKN